MIIFSTNSVIGPGPDVHRLLFQKCWDILGHDVVTIITDFF